MSLDDFSNEHAEIRTKGSRKVRKKFVSAATVQVSCYGTESSVMVDVDRPAIRMFTQQLDTVRWETSIADKRGLELRVFGPGALRRSYSFQDALSLVEYQVQFERQLLSSGYGLMALSERRIGYDRRRQPRTAEDRRKQ